MSKLNQKEQPPVSSFVDSKENSKENFENRQTPNLDLSRENTPYFEECDRMDVHQETFQKSETSSSGDEGTRSQSSNLRRAQTKRLADAPPGKKDPKKKVFHKAFCKLWVPLDFDSLRHISELCSMASRRVVERLDSSSDQHAKKYEAQRLISSHWTNETFPKSFCARLKLSKLPNIKSLPVKVHDASPEPYKPLDIYLLQRRKAALEKRLVAELEELDKLEKYYDSAKSRLHDEIELLEEIKRGTSELQDSYEREIQEKRATFKLQDKLMTNSLKNLRLIQLPVDAVPDSLIAFFDPDQDEEVSQLMKGIATNLSNQFPDDTMLAHLDQLSILEQVFHAMK